MRLIVGLGNPGRRYEGTAHNLGFEVVDLVARRWGLSWRLQERYRSEIAEGRVAGKPALLVKPLTFMNCSGEAVAPLLRQRENWQQNLMVVVDDVSLPIGRLRIRPSGKHGGHNGLRSLIERLGDDQFSRLRVGIRSELPIEDLAEYVLQKLPPLQRRQLAEMTEVAADVVEAWMNEDVASVADRFNGLRRFDPPATGSS